MEEKGEKMKNILFENVFFLKKKKKKKKVCYKEKEMYKYHKSKKIFIFLIFIGLIKKKILFLLCGIFKLNLFYFGVEGIMCRKW